VVSHSVISELAMETPSRILLLVMDGVGGLPHPDTGKTELETAVTPNLDALAARSACGQIDPVGPGITPGSGPGHLGLFGYEPVANLVGRGILSALGVNFPIERTDVCVRGNFASADEQGRITDRRAGRIATEVNMHLVADLRQIAIPGVVVFIETEAQHRFVAIFRGEGLSDQISDTDPQATGVPALAARALAPEAERSAAVVNEFVQQAREILKTRHPANYVLLRGFAKHPDMPTFADVYKLKAAVAAVYPMYRGLGRLVGMDVLDAGHNIADQIEAIRGSWSDHTFFFLHYKYTDSTGEDGNFAAKVAAIEDLDKALPAVLALGADVIAVTGDHSTPSVLKAHSWHPVPCLIQSKYAISDSVGRLTERACASGSLGRFPGVDLMPLLLANSLKLAKFGA
jgi:2,3-bisphosphoglycerate-independent phosphoglycerate mutase